MKLEKGDQRELFMSCKVNVLTAFCVTLNCSVSLIQSVKLIDAKMFLRQFTEFVVYYEKFSWGFKKK